MREEGDDRLVIALHPLESYDSELINSYTLVFTNILRNKQFDKPIELRLPLLEKVPLRLVCEFEEHDKEMSGTKYHEIEVSFHFESKNDGKWSQIQKVYCNLYIRKFEDGLIKVAGDFQNLSREYEGAHVVLENILDIFTPLDEAFSQATANYYNHLVTRSIETQSYKVRRNIEKRGGFLKTEVRLGGHENTTHNKEYFPQNK